MRITPAEIKSLPFWLRWFFNKQQKKYGQMLQPALVWSRKPSLFVLFASMWARLSHKSSALPADLRALIQVYVAKLTWCHFCVDLNSLTLISESGGEEKLHELDDWQNSSKLSEAEKAALAWTKAMSGEGCQIDDQLHSTLKQHFSEQQIMELTALISFQNMSARFNAALDLPSQGLCEMPVKK
ncbi:carboxymuconolactone decarboxylase family protein [Pelagibaculum spongiae]|uniref:Carboxymuconolactone decarboxylase family protein n=1 Tax=Pelagibaculum spongiae TaxID=2080658 RepID=A0A2V1GQN0_9GAMM|nr:carboxymuconolactone decarboxylase family protein [Pelagibaculum spongiae]PVZ66281.1 carboxymuconolactone decarboxylase family protein [Pelagibaculum spongiae]